MNTKVLKISRKVVLIDKFKELGFKVGVEIGTDRGDYARDICSRYPEVKLFTIDPYLPYNEGKEVKTEKDMQAFYEEAKAKLAPYDCEIIYKTSMEAVNQFEPESIDFVFIDGNHQYEYVYEDITEWTKRVRKGGIVCGHDYIEDPSRKYGVIKAVNQYIEENNVDLYVLRKGTFVDCWMFYK